MHRMMNRRRSAQQQWRRRTRCSVDVAAGGAGVPEWTWPRLPRYVHNHDHASTDITMLWWCQLLPYQPFYWINFHLFSDYLPFNWCFDWCLNWPVFMCICRCDGLCDVAVGKLCAQPRSPTPFHLQQRRLGRRYDVPSDILSHALSFCAHAMYCDVKCYDTSQYMMCTVYYAWCSMRYLQTYAVA